MHTKNNGFTLVEMLLAISIIAILSVTIIYLQTFMSRQSVNINDRVFATEKTIQMIEELRSIVAGSEKIDIRVLDDYDDGVAYSDILTTNKSVTEPGHTMSGNKAGSNGWKFIRRVSVIKIPEEPFARKVYVRVYKNSMKNPGTPSEALSESVAILKTIASQSSPSECMDLYIIELVNAPGWWSNLSTMVPMFDSIIEDLRSRNTGLEFNIHKITRAAYGRDPYYSPYINDSTRLNAATFPVPYVYFYPGLIEDDGGNDFFFFDSDLILREKPLHAKITIDGVRYANDSETYPIADMYNHAVRYPEEKRLYDQAVANATATGSATPEKSLLMILEEMNTSPDNFKNALIVNLHGELIPFPPIRNYSDAAKDPANHYGMRIVTHPEQLKYNAGSQVKLRVYSYSASTCGITGDYFSDTNLNTLVLSRKDGSINFNWGIGSPGTGVPADNFSARWTGNIHPKYSEVYTFETATDDGVRLWVDGNQVIDNWTTHSVTTDTYTMAYPFVAGHSYDIKMEYYENAGVATAQLRWESASQPQEIIPFDTIPYATVYLPDDNVNVSNITAQKIVGGASVKYARIPIASAELTGGSTCQVTHPAGGGTLITIFDSPVYQPLSSVAPYGGLRSTWTLYGLEYIPCPVGSDFSNDLVTSSNTKNTARWVITLAASALSSGMHTIETRLGGDLTSGTPTGASNQKSNLSKTYVWMGIDPPATEQYQFMGDPRHSPYLDIKTAHRYNWYFTAIPNAQYSYSGFTQASNGWGDDSVDVDIPRFFKLFRHGLLNTQSIWTAMNGWSYYYYSLGGEFGSDMAPITAGVRSQNVPWNAAGDTSQTTADEILPDHATEQDSRLIAKSDLTWYAKDWIGELYPDYSFTMWISSGNLFNTLAGNPSTYGKYYRQKHSAFTVFGRDRNRRTRGKGCMSFFNGTTTGASGSVPFGHQSTTGTGSITNLGLTLSTMFSMPLLSGINAYRPFSLSGTSDPTPDEWGNAEYSGDRTTLSLPIIGGIERTYYTSDSGNPWRASSAVRIKQTDPVTNVSSTAYVSVSGLSTQADFGSSQMGKFVIATMLRTFLDGGTYAAAADKISQIPRVTILKPKISDAFNNPASIVIESTTTWKRWDGQSYTEEYSATYSEATALSFEYKYFNGIGWYYCSDDSPAKIGVKDPSKSTSAISYTWAVTPLPEGSYTIRVECYRSNYKLHYSYHEIQIYLHK